MSASRPVLYEGMFLFDSAAVQSSVAIATEALNEVFKRSEAEVVSLHRWDERKLAYPIKGQKRGLYMLAYFNVRGSQIPNIERDVTLSEQLLRCMILRADHVGQTELELAEEMAKETQAAEALERSGEGAEGAAPAEGEAQAEGEAAPAAEATETAETTEGSRTESEAAASAEPEAPRPTPAAGDEATEAPESGTRDA
ncbi:MAG: 30S ribosomal protein S6 [Phycisphaeraceae bacterium]